MKVFMERTNAAKTMQFSGKVKDLVKKLGINPETVLVTRNKELLTEEDAVSNTDEIKILSVISGG